MKMSKHSLTMYCYLKQIHRNRILDITNREKKQKLSRQKLIILCDMEAQILINDRQINQNVFLLTNIVEVNDF